VNGSGASGAGRSARQAEIVELSLTGSLNGRGRDQAGPLGLGPDMAAALGFRGRRAQLGLTVIGVVLGGERDRRRGSHPASAR
jgi:hypothetical protein